MNCKTNGRCLVHRPFCCFVSALLMSGGGRSAGGSRLPVQEGVYKPDLGTRAAVPGGNGFLEREIFQVCKLLQNRPDFIHFGKTAADTEDLAGSEGSVPLFQNFSRTYLQSVFRRPDPMREKAFRALAR